MNPSRTLRGNVQDTTLTSVRIVHNGADTSTFRVSQGRFSAGVALTEGANTYVAIADSAGSSVNSSPVTYTVSFNATGLSSGVYLYRLTAAGFTDTRKMVIVR